MQLQTLPNPSNVYLHPLEMCSILYSIIEENWEADECAHTFHVNTSTLHLSWLPTNLYLDTLGNQLGTTAMIKGKTHNFQHLFKESWADPSNLTTVSFHNSDGVVPVNTTMAEKCEHFLAWCCQWTTQFHNSNAFLPMFILCVSVIQRILSTQSLLPTQAILFWRSSITLNFLKYFPPLPSKRALGVQSSAQP